MSTRPRILYLTSHCPASPTYGGQLRATNVARLLQRLGDVSMVIASWNKWPEAEICAARSMFDVARVVDFEAAPLSFPWGRARHELDPGYLNTDGLGTSREDADAVRRLIGEHDVTWFHTIVVANAFRIGRGERSVLDLDDLYSRYYAGEAGQRGGLRRLNSLRKSRLWRRREARVLDRFAVASVCSAEDREYLGGSPRIHVVPNGFEAPAERPRRTPVAGRLGMIGKISYTPNRDGLRWFLERAWPEVRRAVPGAELRVVGEGGDAPDAPAAEGVTRLGWVAETAAEMATWSASIVPILVGGGTRIKIAEAFARGVPVVSTSLGAFGYPVASGRELLLADEPSAFAAACVRVLAEPSFGDELARRGWDLFRASYSWDAIAPAVERTLEACREASARAAPPLRDASSSAP